LGSTPTPSPFPVNKFLYFSVKRPVCRRSSLQTGQRRGGLGMEPDHTTTRKPGPPLIVQCSLISAVSVTRTELQLHHHQPPPPPPPPPPSADDGPSHCGGVLDEPCSQLSPLSGVAVQAGQSRLEPCPSYVAWRAGMGTPLNGLGSSKTPTTVFGSSCS
jgi:hypothetical protein